MSYEDSEDGTFYDDDEDECGMPWPYCNCGYFDPPSPALQQALMEAGKVQPGHWG